MREIIKLFVLSFALMFTSVLLLVLVKEVQGFYEYHFGFDREVWRASAQGSARQAMVQDLIAHELPAGMSHQAVVRLLGAPNYATSDDSLSSSYPMTLGYRLTTVSSSYPELLEINLTDQGRIGNCRIE